LTLEHRRAPRACVNYATKHPHYDANGTRKTALCECKCCKKRLPRRRFRLACIRRSPFNRCHRVALSRHKPYRADSESRSLAIKKFSCSLAWRLIKARQTRFFSRIAIRRFGTWDFSASLATSPFYGERSVHARADEREARRRCSHHLKPASDAEFGFEQIIHGLRVDLASG
jgi:hypothetical protein